MDNKLENLINYCKENDRICPMPTFWLELFDTLKNKKHKEPSVPLILAAWFDTPAILKQLRLFEHIEWAEKNGQIEEVSEYLRDLKEDQWYHLGE